MKRIFVILAAIDYLALLASFGVGAVYKLSGPNASLDVYLVHYTLGLSAVLGNLLVHCLVITYFLGTGRMVKEIALAYELPDEQWPRVTRDLKRRNTPWALLAMGVAIAAAATGQGAQTMPDVWPWWIHLVLATATLAVNAWVFPCEYRNIGANGVVLDEVMREVDRVRAERGLPSNAEALEQEQG